MRVPFLNLGAAHEPIRDEIRAAIETVMDTNAFAGGPLVARFEEQFAEFCQARFASGVGSGTDALWFALLALGVCPGDEVITTPNTFIATAEAISFCGARPVFVDVEPGTLTMDPEKLEEAITPRTKGIIPVHLYGQPADMDPIMEIAARRGLFVVEDACQAHGAEYRGRKVGSIGHAGCFSFYPGKNLGALGEAGAVVTNDAELNQKIQILRDHGQSQKYFHEVVGWNGRMDGIQGAVLQVKLRRLAAANEARQQRAAWYRKRLDGRDGITLPFAAEDRTHVYHLFVARVSGRDELLRALAERGISCGIHYPTPLHLQKAYRHLGRSEGAFPVAEEAAKEILSLPMFPELTEEQVDAVVTGIEECRKESSFSERQPALSAV